MTEIPEVYGPTQGGYLHGLMAWIAGHQPPPGWYPDPSGQPGSRWWDGRVWTASLALYPTPRAGLPAAPSGDGDAGPHPLPARAAWLAVPGILVGFFLSGVFQLLGTVIFPGSTAADILLGEIGLWCGLGGTCVVVCRRFGTGSLVRDLGWRLRLADLAFGPLAALVCLFAAGFIGGAFSGTRFSGSNTNIITSQKGNTVGVAVVTVIAAVGAPIFEELFFRGFLRLSLASRLGVGAVWVQALFFGLAHYQFGLGLGNVSVVCATAGIGVVLGYTAHLTRRLGAGSIAHGLFNLFVTLTIIGVIR
jgi:membrane protease YdiL (CAAX protease family)